MGTLTVRNVEEETKQALRLRAARKGVSMEQEVRTILREAARAERPAREGTWRLRASRGDILALARKPSSPIDHKAESDSLYDYLERE